MDKLTWWEKLPILGMMTAQGAYVWQWYVGGVLALPVAVVALAGAFAVAAIDGAMVATVMGMRAGRRSPASYATIVVTAAFGAFVALDLYGAVPSMSAWLHAGFAATIVCYLLHLQAPRRISVAAEERAAQAEREAAHAALALAQAEADAAQWREALALAEDRATQSEEQAAQLREVAAQAEAGEAQLKARVARRLIDNGTSQREAARLLDMSDGTLRRWLGSVASAAD